MLILSLYAQFKQVSIAYQVLSDPELRHKYNEFGQKNGGGVAEPAGGFQDPEEVFGKMFGGDRFDDFIGQISIGRTLPLMTKMRSRAEAGRCVLGKDMKEAFQQQHEQEEGDMIIGLNGRPMLTPEAMQRKMLRDKIKQEEVGRLHRLADRC